MKFLSLLIGGVVLVGALMTASAGPARAHHGEAYVHPGDGYDTYPYPRYRIYRYYTYPRYYYTDPRYYGPRYHHPHSGPHHHVQPRFGFRLNLGF